MELIKAFCALQRKKIDKNDPLSGERILFSVCTGSLFLATAGVLSSPKLKVTTHPRYYSVLKEILKEREKKGEGEGGEVVESRYVVNKVDEKGVRVVTCGGVTSGFDGALWLVERIGGGESREWVQGIELYEGRGGGFIV